MSLIKLYVAPRARLRIVLPLIAVGLASCSGSGGGGSGSGGGSSVSPTYSIGGTVGGLAGSGLELQNNAGDNLVVPSNGSFRFKIALANASHYAVTVRTQPSSPSQTCRASNGDGTVNGANVTDVRIDCATNNYFVAGTVTGLAGAGLVLQLNGGDNVAIGANPNFSFSTAVASGDVYAVTVFTQPSSPAQTCSVSGGSSGANNGSGIMGGASVNNIIVSCVTNAGNVARSVSATVSGWSGTGTAPVLQLNGGNALAVVNGVNTFGSSLTDGSAYNVTVSTQPTGPAQTCTVANGSGTVSGGNVTVTVTCAGSTYAIGGTIGGLAGSGLQLQLSGGEMLSVAGNGGFAFANAVANGSPYSVTIHRQPSSPSQTCAVANATGTVNGAGVNNVQVSCATNAFNVAVTVNGLSGTGLVLTNNGADDLAIGANGSYAFSSAVASGASYHVAVRNQPSTPLQICTVSNASGTVGNGNVSGVAVNCAANAYSIGGSISGLTGNGLVLQLNGGGNLAVSSGGTGFVFADTIADGSSYDVTVLTQPSSQTCAVVNGSGTVTAGNVSAVSLVCSAASWAGVAQYGTSADDVGNAVTVDSNGNVIVVGCSSGALRADHSNYKNTCDTIGGSANGLVRKYDAIGAVQWTRQLSNGVNVEANAVTTDANRNIYVTGFVHGALPGHAPFGGKDAFLAKYDEFGNRLWTYQFGTVTADQGNALAIDANGNLYVVGTTFGVLGGSGGGNNYDVFVARFDAASLATAPTSAAWLVQFGTAVADYGLGIAADAGGNLFVSGVTLGTLGGSAYGFEDIFIAKLSANDGHRSWTTQLGSGGYDYNGGVAVDTIGNVYVSGYTTGFFGLGAYDAFVASYDTHGAQRWLRQLLSTAHDYTTGIAVVGDGVFISGYTVGNFDGNANADPSGNTTDVFVARYDTAGNMQWTRSFGTSTDDRSYAAAADANGNVYVTGYTLGGLDGGINNGGADVFVVKYNGTGTKQ